MKIIAVIIGIVAVGAIAAGAVYTGLIEIPGMPGIPAGAIDAVPSGVDIVGIANWDKMINDRDVRSLGDKFLDVMDGEYTSFDEAYSDLKDKAEDEAGIDLDKISSVVFFGKIPKTMGYYGTKPPEYFGLIIESDLDKDKIIAKIREEGEEIEEETHNGVDVSIIATGQEPEVAIAELDKLLLFGTKEAVFDSIDAKKDSDERLKGELKNSFDSVKGNFIKVAVEIPEELREEIEKQGLTPGAPIDISKFSKIEYVAYGLNKEGKKFSTHVSIRTSDKSSAKDVADVIEGAVKMYKGMAPEETKKVLEKYEITQSDTTVKIDSEITVEEIEEAIEAIEELSKSKSYPFGG